jgi:hypothetical protein
MGPPTDHALAVSAPASGSTGAELLRDLGRTGQALAATNALSP